MPVIEYSDEAKTNLINELFNDNNFFQFKKWQCIQKIQVTVNTLNFDITNIYRNVNNPIWAFVIFRTNRQDNQQKDNLFDHVNVRNLWIELGGKRYP